MDVSDRPMQAQLTQETKIATDSSFIGAIFAFAGFVSALTRGRLRKEAAPRLHQMGKDIGPYS